MEPEHQGAGIGSARLARAEAWARGEGHTELVFDTAKPARRPVGWYERGGFEVVERVRWEGKRCDEVVTSQLPGAPAGG